MSDKKEHWHLKREVNITHIIVTLTMASGIFVWAATMDKRLSLLEQYPLIHEKMHTEQYRSLNTTMADLKKEIQSNRTIIIQELRRK